MGIPKYFLWITKKYSNLILDIVSEQHKHTDQCTISETDKNNISNINNLFLDANCLIHPCCAQITSAFPQLIETHYNDYKSNKNNINEDLTTYTQLELKMFNKVVEYIVYLTDFSKPNKLVYIAIDGVAPRAKMKQQRYRRYHSYKEKLLVKDIYKKHGIDKGRTWDTNAITPGTMFLTKLSLYIQKSSILKSLATKYNIQIKLSDSSCPGEGEHKIIAYMREHIQPESINVLYGLDADLIMLSLCLEFQIYLLREATHFGKVKMDHLLYFSITNLKNNLFEEITQYIEVEDFDILKQNIIIDYVLLCFLMGNDFLPNILYLDIGNNSIDDIIHIYTNLVSIKKNYLVKEGSINYNFLQQIFNQLFNREDEYLKHTIKKHKNTYIHHRDCKTKLDKALNNLKYLPTIHKINNKHTLPIDLTSIYWKDHYYKYYFNIQNIQQSKSFIDLICKNYISGLEWTLAYYLEGCPSWTYYYKFRMAPCLKDICGYLNNKRIYKTPFELGTPYKPLEQLAIVLPRYSFHLMPASFITSIKNRIDILQFYPTDFTYDLLHHRYLYQCKPILPSIHDAAIKDYIKSIHIDKITQLKNKMGSLLTIV
jgi:5'-3' exoribonuclease 2